MVGLCWKLRRLTKDGKKNGIFCASRKIWPTYRSVLVPIAQVMLLLLQECSNCHSTRQSIIGCMYCFVNSIVVLWNPIAAHVRLEQTPWEVWLKWKCAARFSRTWTRLDTQSQNFFYSRLQTPNLNQPELWEPGFKGAVWKVIHVGRHSCFCRRDKTVASGDELGNDAEWLILLWVYSNGDDGGDDECDDKRCKQPPMLTLSTHFVTLKLTPGVIQVTVEWRDFHRLWATDAGSNHQRFHELWADLYTITILTQKCNNDISFVPPLT